MTRRIRGFVVMAGYCMLVGVVTLGLMTACLLGASHGALVWRRHTLNQHYALQIVR